MTNKRFSDKEFQRLHDGYSSLLDWAEASDLEDKELLGLFLKASTSIAVFNEIPKRELLEVVNVLFSVERAITPRPDEMH